METTKNTILIIGGSAGIGFEMAKLFVQKGNQVIITGRNKERLQKAASELGNVTTVVSDVSKEEDTKQLVEKIQQEYPQLTIVINNAAAAYTYTLAGEGESAFEKASQEIQANYLSVIRLNEQLLPLLKKQKEAAIVNVTSIVAFAPGLSVPTYSASKAALHSYSQILRLSLAGSQVKVFELMPPLVDTEFSKEIGGHNGVKPVFVAERLLDGLAKNEFEIHVGQTADIYKLFLSSPQAALHALNGVKEEVVA